MSMSAAAELALITAAQGGDQEAATTLVEAHAGLILSAVNRYPGYDRANLKAELNLALFEAIKTYDVAGADTESGTTLWGSCGKRIVGAALNAVAGEGIAVSVPKSVAQYFRQVQRVAADLENGEHCEVCYRTAKVKTGTGEYVYVEDGAELSHALAHASISETAYRDLTAQAVPDLPDELDQGHKDRFGITRAPYDPEAEDMTKAEVEVALDAMTPLQRYLNEYKYGFEPVGFDSWEADRAAEDASERRALPLAGRADLEVAAWYRAQPAASKPLTRSGAGNLSRQAVQKELDASHERARAALHDYYFSDPE